MKYPVKKEKIICLLNNRPALVKNIPNLTEDFCIEAIESIRSRALVKFYECLPIEMKTLKVSKAYVNRNQIEGVPDAIKKLFPEKLRKYIIKNVAWSGRAIESLPEPTSSEWLIAIKSGYNNIEKIPKELYSQEFILTLIKQGKVSMRGIKEIAEPFWTPDFALACIKEDVEAIKILPTHLITGQIFDIAVQVIDLSEIKIPENIWNQDRANEAVESDAYNIRYLPKQYITESLCERAAEKGAAFEGLPFKTYPVLVAFVTSISKYYSYKEELKEKIKKLAPDYDQFILDVTQKAKTPQAILYLDYLIKDDLWPKILKIAPESIKLIEKENQTEDMISAFFSVATPEIIDANAPALNLGKIKATHAPLLISCNHPIILGIVDKYFKGQPEAIEGAMEICLSPAEYTKLKYLLE